MQIGGTLGISTKNGIDSSQDPRSHCRGGKREVIGRLQDTITSHFPNVEIGFQHSFGFLQAGRIRRRIQTSIQELYRTWPGDTTKCGPSRGSRLRGAGEIK